MINEVRMIKSISSKGHELLIIYDLVINRDRSTIIEYMFIAYLVEFSHKELVVYHKNKSFKFSTDRHTA